jgi:hypothetical protein
VNYGRLLHGRLDYGLDCASAFTCARAADASASRL